MQFDFNWLNNDYGLSRDWKLRDYLDEADERDLLEQLGITKASPLEHASNEDLTKYYPSSFDTSAIGQAVSDLDKLLAPSTAPTGINPAAPASSQPPAVGGSSGSMPATYKRMAGVTTSDRLGAIGMAMSAVGTPQFATVYKGATLGLIEKQREADDYNRKLDMATQGKIEWKDGVAYRMPSALVRNSDGTYSINEKAGEPQRITSTDDLALIGRDLGMSESELSILRKLQGKNADSAWGYLWHRSKGYEGSLEDWATDPRNALNGETSKKFYRNQDAFQLAGFEERDAFQLASLADRGNLTMRFDDTTGEILFADPTSGEMRTFRTAEEGIAKIAQAIRSEEEIKRNSSLARTDEELAQQRRSKQIQDTETLLNEKLETFRIGQDQLDRSQDALKLLDKPQTETGMVNRLILDYLGVAEENMARLSTMSKTQIIETVKDPGVTLTPVSDPDIRMLEALWGDTGKNPATMRAQIKQFIAEKERELKGIQRSLDTTLLGFSGVDWENQNAEGYLQNWRKNYAPIFNWKTFAEIQAEIDAAIAP